MDFQCCTLASFFDNLTDLCHTSSAWNRSPNSFGCFSGEDKNELLYLQLRNRIICSLLKTSRKNPK